MHPSVVPKETTAPVTAEPAPAEKTTRRGRTAKSKAVAANAVQ
jgi:hypothetical protein